MTSELFTCCNCNSLTTLDSHGRCTTCGSDAVVRRSLQHLALLARLWPEEHVAAIMELEKIWRNS